jgi:hypothetical protein
MVTEHLLAAATAVPVSFAWVNRNTILAFLIRALIALLIRRK